MGQCPFQGNAVLVGFPLAGISFHLAGSVQRTGGIQRHIRLGARITESSTAEHCRSQDVASCDRELEIFDPSVIAGVANTGHGGSLEYRPPQMGGQLSTVCPASPARSCGAIHCVHNYSR